jgi:hypothetical protein
MEISVESGKTAAIPSGESTALATGTQQIANALTASDVYVDQSLLQSVNVPTLQEAAENDDHTTAKTAIINAVPDSSDVDHMVGQLHHYLNLGRCPLILVAMHGANGAPGGVAISADTLTSSEEGDLAGKYIAQIGSGNLTAGVSALTAATTTEIDAKERRMPDMFMWLVLLALVVAGLLVFAATRRKKAQLEALRIPLNTLRANVLENIQYIDNYADVLPKNNADTDQVKAYRQAAEAKFEQADKIMQKATDTSELYRAQNVLDKANTDLSQARKFLDRATGGTSKIPGDDAVRPVDLPQSVNEAMEIPETQRGVSFFSSQPAPISGLVPVTLNVGGQNRTVMATADEAQQVRQGQTPAVRAFNDNGRMVPWYNYQSYDPYRDYYQYQNQGWGGFGTGAITGFIGAELLDSLFTPHYYGNWYSPYGYSPGFGSFSGWNDYGNGFNNGGFDMGQSPGNFAFDDQYTQPPTDLAGGASFLGSGYDQSDYGSSGDASFLGGGDHS